MYLFAWWCSSVERKAHNPISKGCPVRWASSPLKTFLACRHAPRSPRLDRPSERMNTFQAIPPALDDSAARPDGPAHWRRPRTRAASKQQPRPCGCPALLPVGHKDHKIAIALRFPLCRLVYDCIIISIKSSSEIPFQMDT